MQKIPTIFQRDWNGDRSRVVDEPHPACGWVFAGEGRATRKIDGTACLVRDGRLFKRRELRAGEARPAGFETLGADPETGKTVGWVPVGDGPEDRWHREGLAALADARDGTYELIGPKVQANPEGSPTHVLVRHDTLAIEEAVPRSFEGLRAWLEGRDMEGLVFHHPDGRMGKIKLRDFGHRRRRA